MFSIFARRQPPVRAVGRPRALLSLRTYMRLALDPKAPAGDCTSPVVREVLARDRAYKGAFHATSGVHEYAPSADFPNGSFRIEPYQEWRSTPDIFGGRILRLDIQTRCRKCDACKAWKRRLWTARAFYEAGQSFRTWLCTFTLGYEGRLRASTSGDPDKWLMTEMQSYLKRLREDLGPNTLRFLRVVEHHEDGTPHGHMLIHDLKGRVVKRAIQRHWRHGFSHAKLADGKGIRYVCKYVSKDARLVRASVRYGGPKG